VALATPPAADAAGKPSDAKAHADRARRLYDLRLYDKAIEEFEAAYRDSGDPAYLYNLGQSHRLAGHTEQAIRNYELYLEKVPQAPNRPDIEKRIAELKPAAAPAPAEPPPAAPPPPAPPVAAPSPPVAVVASPTAAGAVAVDDHRHDGLFLRALLGPSYAEVKANDTDETTLLGTGAGGTFAGGWTFKERWAVFGEVGGTAIPDPKATIKDASATVDGKVNLVTVGAGLAYFLMPANVYFSGTLGATQAQFTIKGNSYRSHWGPAVNLVAGKEWWISRDLGFGAALMLHRSAQKDPTGDGTHATWTSTAVVIAASATYN
jgi:hypothetical protein